MSKIKFLDNVNQGKNSLSAYILTIGISVIGGTIASIFILVSLMLVYILSYGIPSSEAVTKIFNDPTTILIMVGVSYGLYFFLFYLCLRFIHKKRLIWLINIGKSINWKGIGKGAGLWVGLLTFFTVISLLLTGSSGISFNFKLYPFLLLVVVSVLVFPMQASFEEIFFRGYLMQAIGLMTKKPVIPLVLTSLIFGMLHFFNGTNINTSSSLAISAIILGLMLGIIVLGENGLETAIGVHIANNMFVALFFDSSNSGLGGLPSLVTAPSSNTFTGIPMLILMAAIMILILFWNKKESVYNIFR